MTTPTPEPDITPTSYRVTHYGFNLHVVADGDQWAIQGVAVDLVTAIAPYGAPVIRDQRWSTPEAAEQVAVGLLALGAQFAAGVIALVKE